jgi:hypothetical protein
MSVASCLEDGGLGEYAARFRAAGVADVDQLVSLTMQDYTKVRGRVAIGFYCFVFIFFFAFFFF